jgi:hypothetical protein
LALAKNNNKQNNEKSRAHMSLLRNNSIFPVIEIAKQARFWARIKLFIMEEYGYNNTTTQ